MRIIERVKSDAAMRIDREGGFIYGVKVLGLTSKNGREYDEAAVKAAAPLYEGKAVNVDHIENGQRRSYGDRIGRLITVKYQEDPDPKYRGLFGTLAVNPKHPLAEQLFWDAENAPENVGLSHDVTGETATRGGKTVVVKITSVKSVDLVADPASTGGLFEGTGDGASDARNSYGGPSTWGDDPALTGRLAEGEWEQEERSWCDEPEREPEHKAALSEAYRTEQEAERQATITRWTSED